MLHSKKEAINEEEGQAMVTINPEQRKELQDNLSAQASVEEEKGAASIVIEVIHPVLHTIADMEDLAAASVLLDQLSKVTTSADLQNFKHSLAAKFAFVEEKRTKNITDEQRFQ